MAEKKKEEKDSEVFVLKLNNDGVVFTNPKLGDETTSAMIKLSNPTKEKYAFKIKCTSNEMFKIKLPVGYLKPDETIEIPVFHIQGKGIPENSKQYFVIYYVKISDSDEKLPVRELWATKKKTDGVKRVHISFLKPDEKGKGEDGKKDGKKEEKKE